MANFRTSFSGYFSISINGSIEFACSGGSVQVFFAAVASRLDLNARHYMGTEAPVKPCVD